MSQGVIEFQLCEDMQFANVGKLLCCFALLLAKVSLMALQTRNEFHQIVQRFVEDAFWSWEAVVDLRQGDCETGQYLLLSVYSTVDLLDGSPALQPASLTCHCRRVMRDGTEYLLRDSREGDVQQIDQLSLNVRELSEFGSDSLQLLPHPGVLFRGLIEEPKRHE